MAKKIIFLEFKEETKTFIKLCNNDSFLDDGDTVIALSYETQVYLIKSGIKFSNSLKYFNNKSHADLLLKSENLLQLIENNLKIEKLFLGELTFFIRPLIHYLLFLSEIISNAVIMHNPKVIYGPEGKIETDENNGMICYGDRMLGYLLKSYSENNNINYNEITLFSNASLKKFKPSYFYIWVETIAIYFFKILETYKIKKYHKNCLTVLLPSDGYGITKKLLNNSRTSNTDINLLSLRIESFEFSIKYIINYIKRVFYKYGKNEVFKISIFSKNLYYGKNSKEINIFSKCLDKLNNSINGKWKHEFSYKGIFFSKCITNKYSTGIKSHLLLLAILKKQVKIVLRYLNPDIVISPYDVGISSLVATYCKNYQIPTVLLTHGSIMPPNNKVDEVEIRRLSMYNIIGNNYEYSVAQSPWIVKHLNHFNKGYKILKTKPLFSAIDSLKGKKLRKKLGIGINTKVVLYAVTEKSRSSLRFQAFETPDEVIKSMHDIIKSVNQITDVHLIIKLHPSSSIDIDIFDSLLPRNDRISILTNNPFEEVLSSANILISYSSSTIEQAIFNKIPVVLFDRWNRYCYMDAFNCDNLSIEKLKVDSVYYTNKANQLSKVIKFALNNIESIKTNVEIYKRHSFYSGEAHNIMSHINNIIEL